MILITGTTSGTGFVAAKTCVKHGATVACLNRPSERSEKALKAIKEEFPNGDVRQIDMDLMDFDSVRKGVEEVKQLFEKVNVVACNAGVMALEDKATKDGYDVQMQVNHLSHFLLVKEIYPLLQKAEEIDGEARIVTHSSVARDSPPTRLKAKYFGKNGGNLGGNGNSMIFGGARWQRYHQTKLANVVFVRALHNRFQAKGSKMKAMSAHPGLAATSLQATTHKDGGMGVGLLGGTGMMMKLSQSPEDGAMGLIRGICSDDVESGVLYGPRGLVGKAVKRPLGRFVNDKAAEMLWTESEKACGEFTI